jgi:hypothetical protein
VEVHSHGLHLSGDGNADNVIDRMDGGAPINFDRLEVVANEDDPTAHELGHSAALRHYDVSRVSLYGRGVAQLRLDVEPAAAAGTTWTGGLMLSNEGAGRRARRGARERDARVAERADHRLVGLHPREEAEHRWLMDERPHDRLGAIESRVALWSQGHSG